MVLPSDSAAERLVSPDLCWSCLHCASFPVEHPAMSRGGLRVGFAPFAAGGFVGRSIGHFCLCETIVQPPSFVWMGFVRRNGGVLGGKALGTAVRLDCVAAFVMDGEVVESWEEVAYWRRISHWVRMSV